MNGEGKTEEVVVPGTMELSNSTMRQAQNGHAVYSVMRREAWMNGKNGDGGRIRYNPMCERFRGVWTDEDSFLRRLFSSLLLTVFAFAGAGMFYVIEETGNPDFHNSTSKAYCAHDFWSCFFFASTLYTTIGFGTISPCTQGGRIFTMIYTICGIPVALVAVADIGFVLTKSLGDVWLRFRSLCKRVKKSNRKKGIKKANKNKRNGLLPFPLAILICLSWILLSALYFYVCELHDGQNWTYFESLYYFVVAVTTTGLGDYDVSRNAGARTVLDFVFFMIGISLFSMCVNIIQFDLENLSSIVAESIVEDYASALGEGHALGMFAAMSGHAQNDLDRYAAKKTAKAAIRNMINKKSSWFVRLFVQTGFEDRLLAEYQKLSTMRLASTQTELHVRHVGTETDPDDKMDKFTSTGDMVSEERHSIVPVPDLSTREQEAVERHMHRISIAQVKRREELFAKLRKTLNTSAVEDD